MFSWSMRKYSWALACAMMALIGANLSLVACSDSIEIVEDPVQVKLWNDLNDKSLSVDQIEDILRQAVGSGVTDIYGTFTNVYGTEIRKVAIAELLALKDLSIANCTISGIRDTEAYMFGNDAVRNNIKNEGIMKFARFYNERLVSLCIEEQTRVIQSVLNGLGESGTKLVENFAKHFDKSMEYTRAARKAMNALLDESEEYNEDMLLAACKYVVDNFPRTEITKQNWGALLRSGFIDQWRENCQECKSLLSPVEKRPKVTADNVAFASIITWLKGFSKLVDFFDQKEIKHQQQQVKE